MSAAERKRRQRHRERNRDALLWERADWRLFLDPRTLPQKAGCQPGDIVNAVVKELVDNACDNGTDVTIEQQPAGYIVRDKGPGIDPRAVPRLFAVNRPLVSSKLRRAPLRGMLGNGLRVVMGAVAASDGSIVVETRGHSMMLSVDPDTGETLVIGDKEIPPVPGTAVQIKLGPTLSPNGNEIAIANQIIAVANTGKPSISASSPFWYAPKDVYDLCRFVLQPSATVGAVAANLGFDLDDPRPAKSITNDDAVEILDRLRSVTSEPAPECLGYLGQEAFATTGYARKTGMIGAGGCRIPFVIEAWADCSRVEERNSGAAEIELYINRTISLAQLRGDSDTDGIGIYGCGLAHAADAPAAKFKIKVALTAPLIDLSSDGKQPALYGFRATIAAVVGKAARQSYRAMKRPERGISIVDVAWITMPSAYMKASDNGKLPANARQIMYAARRDILRLTGKTELSDSYFTQTLLPDYVEANPERCREWDVVFDARGHFIEPHTGANFGIGTIEVRAYLGDRPHLGPAVSLSRRSLYPTIGPANRYDNILFIEKEGFEPLLRVSDIAERFDVSIMSTKGMSTTAARILLDRLAPQIGGKVLVLHDFDVAGFSIFGTLGTDGRRYTFENEVELVDIGLRLNDIERLELDAEPCTPSDWSARRLTLARHGATTEEIEFLKDQRVELNAMTSRQFIDFIEAKLIEHGVEKVIPADDTIETHARRLIEQHLAEQAIEKLRSDIERQAGAIELPDDLRDQIEEALERDPALPWDAALAAIIAGT